MKKTANGFSGSTLKILAILFMVADHTAVALNPQFTLRGAIFIPISFASVSYSLLRAMGRIAFPIFTFFIAEGCRYTRSLPKYIGRLALFALISEVPFQLATTSELGIKLINVYVTLTLGAAACAGYVFLDKKCGKAVALIPFILSFAAAYVLKSDYGIWGVLLIFTAFFLSERKRQLVAYAGILFVIYVFYPAWNGTGSMLPPLAGLIFNIALWGCSMISLILLAKYNGERGSKMKLWFYAFYPAHLSVLVALKWAFGLL